MAENLRHIRGGVIGTFTPVEAVIDFGENAELGKIGTDKLGIKVPAGKFVYGVYVRNTDNTLAADGAGTLTVKVGAETELNALAIAAVKGTGTAKILEEPLFVADEADVTLTIATANFNKGKLAIGVIYG